MSFEEISILKLFNIVIRKSTKLKLLTGLSRKNLYILFFLYKTHPFVNPFSIKMEKVGESPFFAK